MIRPSRRWALGVLFLLFLVGVLAVVWEVNDWPPLRLLLEYGAPPTGGPTGNRRVIEGIEFVELSPGYFRRGTHRFCEDVGFLARAARFVGLSWGPRAKHDEDACPTSWVEVPHRFWIATTELTKGEYRQFLNDTGRVPGVNREAEHDEIPVTEISRSQARDYCEWLTARAGVMVRLPTEREWEFACRAGSPHVFGYGEREDLLAGYAWFHENSGARQHPVAGLLPNDWGLYDMHGNVAEWCDDAEVTAGARQYFSPHELATHETTVHRGGGCTDQWWSVWCGARVFWIGRNSSSNVGFRPVFTLPEAD